MQQTLVTLWKIVEKHIDPSTLLTIRELNFFYCHQFLCCSIFLIDGHCVVAWSLPIRCHWVENRLNWEPELLGWVLRAVLDCKDERVCQSVDFLETKALTVNFNFNVFCHISYCLSQKHIWPIHYLRLGVQKIWRGSVIWDFEEGKRHSLNRYIEIDVTKVSFNRCP